MSGRKWLPADYIDEVVPPPRASASAWIETSQDGFVLAANDIADHAAPVAIVEGQVVLFHWMQSHGSRDFSFTADGYEVDGDEPVPPPGGELCVMFEGDPESVTNSIGSLVDNLRDLGETEGAGNAECYSWSHRPVPFVFLDGGFHKLALSPSGIPTFQNLVKPWMMACFGPTIAADKVERNHRFLEEALELVQACGTAQADAHALVDYVFGRPMGEPPQEVGGVMVTLAAHCLAHGIDMHAESFTELARIWGKVEQIRAKQAAKPKGSPLPQAVAS